MRRKKKQSWRVILVFLCLSLGLYMFFPRGNCALSEFEKRAVWVSYQDLSQLSYQSQKAFERDFQDIISNAQKQKCNTLIVHVRAFSDALYPSSTSW